MQWQPSWDAAPDFSSRYTAPLEARTRHHGQAFADACRAYCTPSRRAFNATVSRDWLNTLRSVDNPRACTGSDWVAAHRADAYNTSLGGLGAICTAYPAVGANS